MSKKQPNAAAEAFVASEACTTVFPDLDLVLEAGQVTNIPAEHLERVLTEPTVVQVFPHNASSKE